MKASWNSIVEYTRKETDDVVEVINEEEEDDLENQEDIADDDKLEEPKQINVQIEGQSRR